jgi:hypothetical protein
MLEKELIGLNAGECRKIVSLENMSIELQRSHDGNDVKLIRNITGQEEKVLRKFNYYDFLRGKIWN